LRRYSYDVTTNGSICGISTLYLAWAPNDTNAVAFSPSTADAENTTVWSANTYGQVGDDPATFFIASQPTLENSQPWSIINCTLHNATYEVAVNFTNGIQNVSVNSIHYINTVGSNDYLDIQSSASANGKDPFTGEPALMEGDLEHFAYQTLMDMLGRLLGGQISVYYRNAAGSFDFSSASTSVMLMSLANTPELGPIFSIAEVCSSGSATCDYASNNTNLNITAPTGGLQLTDAVGQLFQNMTLSLFSNNLFLYEPPKLLFDWTQLKIQDSTSLANSPNTNITLLSPHVRYVYIWYRLIVPYVIGLAFSFIAVLLGLWGLLVNGASYTENFSTVMRTSRHAALDTDISVADASGADPLPKNIAKSRIRFARKEGPEMGLMQREGDGSVGTEFKRG
jgi:hypothetical protein